MDEVKVFMSLKDKCRIAIGNGGKNKGRMELQIPIVGGWFKRLIKCFHIFIGEDEVISEEFEFTSNEQIERFIGELKKRNFSRSDVVFNVERMNPSAYLPIKGTLASSGFDIRSPYDFEIRPAEQRMIPMQFKMKIDPGYEVQIRSRSSIPYKYNCMIPNGIGTVDEDYRGEFKVILFNYGRDIMSFKRGDKIAQIVIKKTENVELIAGKVPVDTERGAGGIGSTGR